MSSTDAGTTGDLARLSTSRNLKLILGSVGVVYGDIGTSPIYALREGLHAAGRNGLGPQEVLGVVSLLLWTLILIVTVKYVILVLRADNRGEGGTLSLLALAERVIGSRPPLLLAVGIAGAALFFGDAIITPAISVLSAVEGLTLVQPALGDVPFDTAETWRPQCRAEAQLGAQATGVVRLNALERVSRRKAEPRPLDVLPKRASAIDSSVNQRL